MKKHEFSFHIKEKLAYFPEIDQVTDMVDQGIENYKVLKKIGKN